MRSLFEVHAKANVKDHTAMCRVLCSIFGFATIIIFATSSSMAANIATTYDNSCAACHSSGALGAIKKGDSVAWQKRIEEKGMPALVKTVKNGSLRKPAGGLCDNCSDDDYRQLIEYMSK